MRDHLVRTNQIIKISVRLLTLLRKAQPATPEKTVQKEEKNVGDTIVISDTDEEEYEMVKPSENIV